MGRWNLFRSIEEISKVNLLFSCYNLFTCGIGVILVRFIKSSVGFDNSFVFNSNNKTNYAWFLNNSNLWPTIFLWLPEMIIPISVCQKCFKCELGQSNWVHSNVISTIGKWSLCAFMSSQHELLGVGCARRERIRMTTIRSICHHTVQKIKHFWDK